MTNYYDDVRRFRIKMGFPVEGDGPPQMVPQNELLARIKHMVEEIEEMREAYIKDDLAGVADGIFDLVYVALGLAQQMRLPGDELWRAIHNANLGKRRVQSAAESKRGDPLDVIKPEGWRPPDVEGIIEKALEGWRDSRRSSTVPQVGARVRSLAPFAGIPVGTVGVVDEDYGTGITVAWDLPERPLPRGYAQQPDFRPPAALDPDAPVRDGFCKRTEMKFLEVVQ